MTASGNLFIGLISGTSGDGIDAALVDFTNATPRLLGQLLYPIPHALKQQLYQLMVPGDNEIDSFGVADHAMGELFADAALQLLQETNTKPEQITAIGSHGQTIRHRPRGQLAKAFTLQIGDPNIIVEKTGITVVADLRRRDMAAGGEGAPLAPGFHRHVFGSTHCDRVIVNIGGIGNITHLPAQGTTIGFDTGPGNGLMDSWIQKHQQLAYDANGAWASGGQIHSQLLAKCLLHPYFAAPPPKSTGREMFTLRWLDTLLQEFDIRAAQDVQATLLELTAQTIRQAIVKTTFDNHCEVYVCGGGAHNTKLMSRLAELLQPCPVATTSELGIAPDWVEAAAFAWFAKQTLNQLPSNLPSVTGARGERILGGIYLT